MIVYIMLIVYIIILLVYITLIVYIISYFCILLADTFEILINI